MGRKADTLNSRQWRQIGALFLGMTLMGVTISVVTTIRRQNAPPRTKLSILIEAHDVAGVRELLKGNSHLVDEESPDGFTPLQEAIFAEDLELTRVLLASGSDVNGFGQWSSPLSTALHTRNKALVDLLIDHNAELNDDHGASSSLLLAETMNYHEIAELLRLRGAKSRER